MDEAIDAKSGHGDASKKRSREPSFDHNDRVDQLPQSAANGLPDNGSTITSIPTKTDDGGSKPAKRTKVATKKPSLVRQASSQMIESSIPWPDYFTSLSSTHRALNLVFTFCCTRKSFATTIDNIRSAVEGHLKRELVIEEVAAIKALLPQAVFFEYVDEEKLQVSIQGNDNTNRRVGDIPMLDSPAKDYDAVGREVLLFEFIDRDMKRQVTHAKTGEPTRAFQKLRKESLKMPVFSQKQMLTTIEKRNDKFKSAVNAFLNQCAEDKIDPILEIQSRVLDNIPEPSSRPGTPGHNKRVTLPREIPKERKSIPEIIAEIKDMEWYSDQIVPDGHRVFDPQEPVYGDLQFQLSQDLVNALYNTRSIEKLYAHQAEAINNLHDGHNVIVATSTSSGKSLIYQIPVIHALEADIDTRAMYIFPTKALAQDQRRSLQNMLSIMPSLQHILVDTFDGDTPREARNRIRDEARVIFTNPDMLHITILPQEEAWRTFLKNLKFVVVDELHVYNGLFGAHVGYIMRRLRRVCAAVGNRRVKFVSCSATVANPEDHMKTIFGIEDIKLTNFDGSPSGRKEFLCWNTPYKDPGDPSSGRGSAMQESAKLFCQLILRGVRVIAFARIRTYCEILLNAVKDQLAALERPEVMGKVMSYRGGYAPQDRRRIEKEMFEGALVGIVATTALELGIDIGSLDAVITVGFPYTIANLRQQSGRAGRRNKDSLSVLVGDVFPTDQHYMENPDEIFTKPNCELGVDLTNMLVVEGHAQCAAHEMPIHLANDADYFPDDLLENIATHRMQKDDEGFFHPSARYLPRPSQFVAIRDTEDHHFAIVDTTNGANNVIEELEASRAFFTIYEGGIFLHQGRTYLVREFLPDQALARVQRVKVDWTTQQREYTDIDPIETEAIKPLPDPSLSRAFFGRIRVTQKVFGYFKLDKRRRILDAVEVDNPPIVLPAKGMWLDVPRAAVEILVRRRMNVAAGIHAAEHAILSLMPQFVVSMPGDVRTECKYAEKEMQRKETKRKRPARLVFYDAKGTKGNSGISFKAFEFIDSLLLDACRRVASCHCAQGCMECCCAELCRDNSRVISKAGAEVVLRSFLGLPIDEDALPWGDEEQFPATAETIVMPEVVALSKTVLRGVHDSQPQPDVDNLRYPEDSNAARPHEFVERLRSGPQPSSQQRLETNAQGGADDGGYQRVALDEQ